MRSDDSRPIILLTGATGYVGRELLKVLRAGGRRVRCMVRRPESFEDSAARDIEVVQGDVLNLESLLPALRGVDTAYYLIHSMSSGEEFEQLDRDGARHFAAAARAAGVRRIIYLGGLGKDTGGLSSHLRSRQEVGEMLRQGSAQVIEFRSSVILGRGSFSFEMIRALVERLPVMVTPKWVSTPSQPIFIADLLEYLSAALDMEFDGHRIFEIGGGDRTSYGGLMREYARQRGLRRLTIPVPVLTPRLSSLWLALVTPYHAQVGRKLIDGLQNPTVVTDPEPAERFGIRPRGLAESISEALAEEDREFAGARWKRLLELPGTRHGRAGTRAGNRFVDTRTIEVNLPPKSTFACIERIGGKTGWYYGDWLWSLRGVIDRALGGVGRRRGRRDPDHLLPGEKLDFWHVEALEPGRRLRLAAEMKLPGRAWLEFQVEESEGGSVVRQTAIFDPSGLAGLAYWYLLYPFHAFIFKGMLHGIAENART